MFSRYSSQFWSWALEDRAFRGLGGPPNGHRVSPRFPSRQHGMSTGTKEFSLRFDNDAHDVWIARWYDEQDTSKWVLAMAAEDFRKLALWYLWRWAWGEWFGLRRRLFYWNLKRRLKAFTRPTL